ELEARRQAILKSIEEQGKLSEALRGQILATNSKTELEDLYLPYKKKRRTRATIAREKGLEPLAALILAQPLDRKPEAEAAAFVSAERGVADVETALSGARDIVAEAASEDARVRALVRRTFADEGMLTSEAAQATTGPTKFEQYYGFKES